MELTSRQEEVFRFAQRFRDMHGYNPTCREISDHFGWSSTNAAMDHLKRLAKKGWMVKTPRGYQAVDA